MASSRVSLPQPPTQGLQLPFSLRNWLQQLYVRLGEGPFMVKGYSCAGLPDPKSWGHSTEFSSLIYVNDDIGGAVLAFSDGTNWRRLTDRSVVSKT